MGATRSGNKPEPANDPEPTTDPAPPSLERLIERLHPAVLDLVAAPRGLDVAAGHPWILDLRDPTPPEREAVVLAVGVEDQFGRTELLRRLAPTGTAAVVFRQTEGPDPALLAAADETGVAVLAARPGVSWGQLFSLLVTASTLGPSDDEVVHGGAPLGDLFALANAVSAMVGGATTIEDPQSRVLAYSTLNHPIDIPRQETILGRQVPAEWMQRLRDAGVFRRLWQTDEVVPIRDFADHPGYLARLAVAVRAGGEVLGSIWVIEGDQPLGPEAERALRQAADIAALHLLAHRTAHDVERQRRADALLSVLEGREPGDRARTTLGIDTGAAMAVIAFDSGETDAATASMRSERVADLVALYCESYRRSASCAVSRGRAYALVPLAEGTDAESVVTLADAIVARAAEALSVGLRAGIGSTVESLAGLVRSREEADDVLDVMGPEPGATTIDYVRAQVVLLRLSQLASRHPELADGRVAAMVAHDRARGSANLATLRAYFDAFGDVATAAARIDIHPNTFRYRLRRISETFGLDLSDPDERLVTELQLRFLDRAAPEGGEPAQPDPGDLVV